MRVYLDNAATTPLDPEVFEAMKPYLLDHYGNPSSIHAHGREVRAAIEKARRTVAELINAAPGEVFFTSGGTEADNMAIRSTVQTFNIRYGITEPLEHHAVLHSMDWVKENFDVAVDYLNVDSSGELDYEQLETLLSRGPQALVSIMYANNEIGNKNDIERIAALCKKYEAIFHSDTVQTMGHFPHDVKSMAIDFLVGSAHKFHGPKGVGFIYINSERKISPLLHGGSQERLMRGGTENVAGIIGLAKAMEMAYSDMENHKNHITALKKRMKEGLKARVPGVLFNGYSGDLDNSLYTVLSVSFPSTELNEMLLFNLDIKGISASGGSACTSGSNKGSHVLQAMKADTERPSIRFSFSKFTTEKEVDYVVQQVGELYGNILVK